MSAEAAVRAWADLHGTVPHSAVDFCACGAPKFAKSSTCGPCSYRTGRRGRRGSVSARFWPKVDKSGECWLWTGGRTSAGYGQVAHEPAHRASWVLANGPIPAGMFVCHHCDTRLCVRPDHLFLGTHADNMADMVAKGRSNGGRRLLTPEQVREIRARRTRGNAPALAAEYGVSPWTIYSVWSKRNWAQVSA